MLRLLMTVLALVLLTIAPAAMADDIQATPEQVVTPSDASLDTLGINGTPDPNG